MTQEMVLGIVRHLLTTLGGLMASKGLIEGGQVEPLAGAVLVLVGFAWSVIAKRK